MAQELDVFKDQTLLTLSFETAYPDLDDALVKQIKYRKPDGSTGHWDATVSGTALEYDLKSGDIDQIGEWQFQTYWQMSADDQSWGQIVKKIFRQPIS